jgi:hypothetical protein
VTQSGAQTTDTPVLPPRKIGRPKGSRNRVTREVRELAGKYTRRVLRHLWKLTAEAKEEAVQLKACETLLAYAHGRPSQTTLIGGDGAHPVTTAALDLGKLADDEVRQLAAITGKASGELPEPPILPVRRPGGLHVNGTAGSLPDTPETADGAGRLSAGDAEAVSKGTHDIEPGGPTETPAGGGVLEPPENSDVSPEISASANGSQGEAGIIFSEKSAEKSAVIGPPAVGERVKFDSGFSITGFAGDRPNLPTIYQLDDDHGRLTRRGSWSACMSVLEKAANGEGVGGWRVEPATRTPRLSAAREITPLPQRAVHRGHDTKRRPR